MRRALLAAALFLVGCGTSSQSADTTVPSLACSPTSDAPWKGMAAVTEDYRVHVWTSDDRAFAELPMVGDDPRDASGEGDMNVVETAAVDPSSCEPIVGTCCEPVSGVSFHDIDKIREEWGMVMGHYPTISPDGARIAFSGYDSVAVGPLGDIASPAVTIPQPPADEASIYDMTWLNDDELVLYGVAPDGAHLWKADVTKGTLGERVLLTKDVSWTMGDAWSIGLAGIDDGMLVVRVSRADRTELRRLSTQDFSVESREESDTPLRSYRISGGRESRVTADGALQVRAPGSDEWTTLGSASDKYVWAG